MIYELVTRSVICLFQVNCNFVDFLFSLSKIDDRGNSVPGDQSFEYTYNYERPQKIEDNVVPGS